MMSHGTAQPVVLIVGNERTTGEVRIERWDPSARLLRAAKRWVVLWGLAVVSVLVPVAHFVLVPALLIAGPIAAFMRWRQRSGVLGGEGMCPACRVLMTIDAHADEWPLFDVCEACRATPRVEKPGFAREREQSLTP
jgi:hypothetical protein